MCCPWTRRRPCESCPSPTAARAPSRRVAAAGLVEVPVSTVDALGRPLVRVVPRAAGRHRRRRGRPHRRPGAARGRGLHGAAERPRRRGSATTLAHALAGSPGRVLVGLGGSACTDGGTGMLRALGCRHHLAYGEPAVGVLRPGRVHAARPLARRRPLRRHQPAARAVGRGPGLRSPEGRDRRPGGAPRGTG